VLEHPAAYWCRTYSVRLSPIFNAAPFAALLLSTAAILASTGGLSRGFYLRVAKLEPSGADDRRIVVLQALPVGFKINVEDVGIDELAGRLETIFRTTAERVVFITAAADVPFGRVAQLIDVAATQVDRIALLPKTQESFLRPHDLLCPALVPIGNGIEPLSSLLGVSSNPGVRRVPPGFRFPPAG
jgi:hypothetical protein